MSGSEEGVRVWSLAGDGECIATLAHGGVVKGLALSRRGGWVASAGGKRPLTVWKPGGGK